MRNSVMTYEQEEQRAMWTRVSWECTAWKVEVARGDYDAAEACMRRARQILYTIAVLMVVRDPAGVAS